MDFIVGLPPAPDGADSIVMFVDCLTKMVHLRAVRTTITAVQTAEVFFD